MGKLNRGPNARYPIPKNLSNSKEIINAIKILSSSNNSDLIKTILKEKEYNIIVDDIKYKYLIEIWIKAFLYEKMPDKSLVPFPQVSPEFLIKKCKNVLENKNDCISFLNFLIKNSIIESKNIYQTLINKFYK